MRLLNRLLGRRYAVYHCVPSRKVARFKRNGLKGCMGVAFYRRHRGPIHLREIPLACETCGQRLYLHHLDLHEVVEPPPVGSSRKPRHHGPKGGLVTER